MAFNPFLGRVPLLKLTTEKKGTLILTSLLEDLVYFQVLWASERTHKVKSTDRGTLQVMGYDHSLRGASNSQWLKVWGQTMLRMDGILHHFETMGNHCWMLQTKALRGRFVSGFS